ncbi:MAG: hypothetical protein K6A78_03340 [Prevotella sp.]|nr:hypothetical protein [Prevotella sp.]
MLILKALLVALEQLLHTFVNLNLVRPAKAVEFGDIDELAHGTIRLAGIKLDDAFKAYGLDNELREFTNGDFLACTTLI